MLYFNYCITNNYHADKVLPHLFRFDILRNFKVLIFQHKDAQSPLSLCSPPGGTRFCASATGGYTSHIPLATRRRGPCRHARKGTGKLADACVFGAPMGGTAAMGIAAEHPGGAKADPGLHHRTHDGRAEARPSPRRALRVALPRDLVPRELPESGGAGRGRVENMGLFACFPLPDASRAGRPRSDCPSALLPLFHVREAVFMGFIADLPPALRPPLLFSFCPFVQNPPPRPPRLRGSAWVLPSRSSAAPPGSGVHGCRGIMEDIGIFGCFPIA